MTISRRCVAGPDGDEVTVTFRFPHAADVDRVCVVGEFNDWSTTATPMVRSGEEFVAELRISAGRTYRFRYLIDAERWENDWAADGYVSNEFGGDDSVIDLTVNGLARNDSVSW